MGENKDTDQLRGNREADQRLCFRYLDSTISLLLKSEISSFYLFSVTVQPGLCRTWSETQIVGFLMHRLKSEINAEFTKYTGRKTYQISSGFTTRKSFNLSKKLVLHLMISRCDQDFLFRDSNKIV